MKKVLAVKELITILLEFNLEAKVMVNANGTPTPFDICWSGDDTDTTSDTRKTTKEVYFDVTQEENV